MNQTLILAINSITLGGLLFLLSSGFSLIFGLMRIPNSFTVRFSCSAPMWARPSLVQPF